MPKSCIVRKGMAFAAIMTASLATPTQLSAQGAPPVSLSNGYLLGVSDVVEVSIAGRDDFKGRGQVQQDGTIVLPLIGTVNALNKTLAQLRDEVRQRLISGGFYTSPDVLVTLASAVSRNVVVLGEVGAPGVLSIDREYRLSELIARAGGPRGLGVDQVTLTTPEGVSSIYSIRAIATGQVADPIVNPSAKIFVAPAQMFYIYGQVGVPGSYPVDAGMTVRRALARGGGLTALGSEKRVKLVRGDTETRVSLDTPVKPGDTIVVGERFF